MGGGADLGSPQHNFFKPAKSMRMCRTNSAGARFFLELLKAPIGEKKFDVLRLSLFGLEDRIEKLIFRIRIPSAQ